VNQAQSTIVGSGVGQPGKYRLSGVTKGECVWAEQNVGREKGKKIKTPTKRREEIWEMT
jgi:hypothetical protein